MNQSIDDIKIGLLPCMLDLYNRLSPTANECLTKSFKREISNLETDGLEFTLSSLACTQEQVEAECGKLIDKDIDLIVVALAAYCPSGVIAPALLNVNTPILLWPTPTILELDPEKYDPETELLNHGVHAVQDLANTLRKNNKAFGVIHGHWQQESFKEEFENWAKAAKAIRSLQKSNPLQIGGEFADMLDLQIGSDAFIKKLGITHKEVSPDEYHEIWQNVTDEQIEACIKDYRATFVIGDDLDNDLLNKAARGSISLKAVMKKYNSSAAGLNFLGLCNDSRIAEPLHIAGCAIMSEGFGYAGEGDWVTAAFVYAMQQTCGIASFSEIFSVGYANNRILLKHWGEGNFAMAGEKPNLYKSRCNDLYDAEFATVEFEFEQGEITLLNLNSTPDGSGQIITITGAITDDHTPKANGPRALFKPDCEDVRTLLTDYAYNGGSHHQALVMEDYTVVAEKICRLAGWKYIRL